MTRGPPEVLARVTAVFSVQISACACLAEPQEIPESELRLAGGRYEMTAQCKDLLLNQKTDSCSSPQVPKADLKSQAHTVTTPQKSDMIINTL